MMKNKFWNFKKGWNLKIKVWTFKKLKFLTCYLHLIFVWKWLNDKWCFKWNKTEVKDWCPDCLQEIRDKKCALGRLSFEDPSTEGHSFVITYSICILICCIVLAKLSIACLFNIHITCWFYFTMTKKKLQLKHFAPKKFPCNMSL